MIPRHFPALIACALAAAPAAAQTTPAQPTPATPQSQPGSPAQPRPAPTTPQPQPATPAQPASTTQPQPTPPAQPGSTMQPQPATPAQPGSALQPQPASPPTQPQRASAPRPAPIDPCTVRPIERLGRNPTPAELRCRYRAHGPGRFGLLSYLDVPVYQPATPLPGTHVVGVPGMPHPDVGESYEHWEWRVLRTVFGGETRRTYREMELLDPVFASKLRRMEQTLASRGVRVHRRETWRDPRRQAWLFQQGRSRPGTFATSTLTSWHCRVDRLGRAAGRAADYDVAPSQMPAFHAAAAEVGVESYGADSNDPGHVYLPDTDAAVGLELAVLRLIPRVPHVTLATGRPDGEPQPVGALFRWRQLTQAFISDTFFPLPATEIVTAQVPRVGVRR